MDRLRPVRWVLAIALVATTIQASFAPVASAGASGTFLVVYKGTAVPSTAEARIQAAAESSRLQLSTDRCSRGDFRRRVVRHHAQIER